MVLPVSTAGERGVITDISFQQGDRDIKVARGNHYSDIVRSSLFRVSILLAPPPLVPLYLVSLFLFVLFHEPALYPFPSLSLAVFSNMSFSLSTEKEDEERRGKRWFLIRIPRSRRRHLVANPFRSRRISTRTRPRNRDEGCVPIARIST